MKSSHLYNSPLFVSVVVAVLTLTAFMYVLSADFVMWDDDIIIYNNPNVQGQLSFAHIGQIFTDIDSMMRYCPLTLLSWNITYHFWELNPSWYHAVNWILHGASSAIVFLVLRKLLLIKLYRRNKTDTDSGWITISAAIGTLLWSLHPLRVEPVAWCTDRTYCQSLFFLLLSLLCYLRSNEANTTMKRHYLFLTASVVLYIVSLLSYSIGITFFFVLLILDIYPLGRLGGTAGWWKSASARRSLLEKVPFAVSALAIALVTVSIRITSAGVWAKPVGLGEFGLFERFMQAMYIWAYYIWRPFYPINLAPVYTSLVSFDPLSLPFVASAIGVIGMIILLIFLRRRWSGALTLAICYFVLLVPVLGVFEHPHYSSDRYSLVVSICFSAAIAAFIANLKGKTGRLSVFFVSIIVIAILGTLSFRQTRIWKNTPSLFTHMIYTLGDDPYAGDIYYRFGSYYLQQSPQDNWANALPYFQKAVSKNPSYAKAWFRIGSCYSNLGRWSEAIEPFKQVIRIKPDDADIHNNLGKAYINLGRWLEAIEALKQAIRIRPDDADTHNNLGVSYGNLGRWSEAIVAFKQAVKIKPDLADAHNNLGVAYLIIGNKDFALGEYSILKTLDTDRAEELFNLISK